MELRSSAFDNEERIPTRYTKEGANASPPLEWSLPANCKEFAIVCEDLDAPKVVGQDHPFTHWLIYNIPPDTNALPEGVPPETEIRGPMRVAQGVNSFTRAGYGGPLPPVDSGPHHYVFTIYALSSQLNLSGGVDKKTLMKAMKGQ